ncbi:MAG: hypothetical protein UF068_03630, partial [Slackia isoflavoniconvertens]|nr:hypothetical protein [Slackia isoflavoniconvertens]
MLLMLWLLAQILFAWLQSFSLLLVAACVAAVGVRIVRAAPIRATVVRRILLLAPFFAAAFSSQAPGPVQNGPRMWCSLGGEESMRISSRNLPGVMLSCNEGNVALAAEVRKKMPHSRPVLNTFEHFVLGFHPRASSRGPLPACRSMVSFWGLISCGLRLETFPGSRIRAQLGFLKEKKERRSIS